MTKEITVVYKAGHRYSEEEVERLGITEEIAIESLKSHIKQNMETAGEFEVK